MVLANFEWMAWLFLLLLSVVFIPHYLRNRISTMPEFLMKRFGPVSHSFFTVFSMFSSLIIWSSFMLYIGGVVIHQLTGIPVHYSSVIIVVIALSYSMNGGLDAIVRTGVIQSVVLLFVSLLIVAIGIRRVGGVEALVSQVPADYWSIFRPANDPAYPWHAVLLGYPVIGIWFWCTEQSVVQRTLAASSIYQGQLGAWLVAVLKIIMPFIFILPGIICFVLVKTGSLPALQHADHAYIAMVSGLLPVGLIGLSLATLMVSVVNDVATGIGSFSTVFAIDLYGKKIDPGASPEKLVRVGKRVTILAGLVSVLVAIFFANSEKGLFELGQSLGTYLAPPVSTVFLFGMLWKRATPRAAELTLYIGTAVCLAVGFCQLIDFPYKGAWPHFMLLCFYMMVILSIFMVTVSLLTRNDSPEAAADTPEMVKVPSPSVRERNIMRILWSLVAIVMMILYYVFR
jgi:SSS family solute:Na+ symporter